MVSNHSTQRSSITIGNTTIETVLLGFFAAKIIWLLAAILFVIQGFRVHWGWGLANLLLFPLAGIALFIKHPREAKYPMIFLASSVVLLLIVLVCT